MFILESIGTSELILIGIIALIFLGPRKLPEIARKMGKIMADFRNTTNEFKSTWEREVNFEEEAKAIKELGNLDAEVSDNSKGTTPRIETPAVPALGISAPEVKEVDASAFSQEPAPAESSEKPEDKQVVSAKVAEGSESMSDKKNWL